MLLCTVLGLTVLADVHLRKRYDKGLDVSAEHRGMAAVYPP